jgi:YHS domain-containing protein
MRGLLSFLLFGAFFYLMMRFGCGAHMVHGHRGHGGDGMSEASAKDPVCGMDVDAGKGYAKMHEGHQYRFCSKQCLDKFDAEPQRYALGKGAHE